MEPTILIAEDEPEIIELLSLYLSGDYNVLAVESGEAALAVLDGRTIDLAILDIMLPGMDGFQLVKKMRERYQFPILFLSSRIDDHDKIWGLGLGADDYMVKPFNPLEVVARVKALLRRASYGDKDNVRANETLAFGNLVLDLGGCVLYKNGHPVTLTPTEFKIVALLMQQAGRVLTKKRIYESVWDDMYAYDDNTIMAHISNLRDKLENDPKQPMYIKTIRGLGYKFEMAAED
ncbi:response regulator transcription factor [Paenibacillus donghaensis]|uniref:response regulator transcription factor n=1 Tax=Paenibacillus donghaensis TaxID=414771 RepID=UPI001883E8FB|nr:response regulator transcription factor [Paenibacillus donghaensis]MBE9918314.1 response regulator transcription factor [Paenibacillus donghaensis]